MSGDFLSRAVNEEKDKAFRAAVVVVAERLLGSGVECHRTGEERRMLAYIVF